MKIAVYSGTRNVYQDMIPSMKSLLMYSDVDKIYFLIEDDTFPYELPLEVECINVSNQLYFDKNGPNMSSKWSYMILLRVVYSKIFPTVDKVLSLDNDIIFTDNVSQLWDINIQDYYFAAVKQPEKSLEKYNYINTGILLMNLKKIRQDHIDNILQNALNTYKYLFPEQDCINEYCHDKIYLLNPEYNVSKVTEFNKKQKAFHYCACNSWKRLPLIQYYNNINYEQILRNIKNNNKLDIIIIFSNIKFIQNTLNSIDYNLPINVTCVYNKDINIENLINNFPTVNFIYSQQENLYQYGLQHTKNSYVMFLQENDYFLSKAIIKEIINVLQKNNFYYIFSFSYKDSNSKKIYNYDRNGSTGNIYSRTFLNNYNIKFNNNLNDMSFMRSALCAINSLNYIEKHIRCNESLISILYHNNNDISNNQQFQYLIENAKATYNINKLNNLSLSIIVNELYYYLIRIKALYSNELTLQNQKLIKQFYYDICKPYIKIFKPILISITKNSPNAIEIINFLQDLQNLYD